MYMNSIDQPMRWAYAVSHSTFIRLFSITSLILEGHAARGVRGERRLPEELLRLALLRAALLRRLRPHGAVRPRQRRRRGAHETPRRVAQAGESWDSDGMEHIYFYSFMMTVAILIKPS